MTIPRIELQWTRYPTMSQATLPYKGTTRCVVYALTDDDDQPVYIGAYLKGRRSGFHERYQGQTGAIDAGMRGTGKHVYVANTTKGQTHDIEVFLIKKEDEADPTALTNIRKYSRSKAKNLDLNHKGEPPRFRYLSGKK